MRYPKIKQLLSDIDSNVYNLKETVKMLEYNQYLIINNDKKERIKYLKKRIDIVCNSKNKKHKNQELKCRARYGTCCCDTYSLDYTLGLVISNYLYQYLADAKQVIERDDWDKIEQCAENIRNYAKTDPWERLLDETKEEFKEKRKLFKESLDWLYENWNTLWW